MAFSPTTFLSALEDLNSENVKLFDVPHPFFTEVMEKGNVEKMEGPFVSWILSPGGPGYVTSHPRGDEVLNRGLKENGKKAKEYLGSASYSFDITRKQVLRLGGKADAAKLLEQKPDEAIIAFKQMLARNTVVGGVAGMDTFFTLNGQKTYDPEGLGARSGLFVPVAKELQSHVVHDVACNSVQGHYHQYEHITNFRTNGTKQMRRAIYEADQEDGATEGSGITSGFTDRETFYNYIEFNDSRTIAVDKPQGDNSQGNSRKGIKFLDTGITLYLEQYLDLSQFTGAMAEGVTYLINPDTFRMFSADGNYDGEKMTDGWFGKIGPGRNPDQLIYTTTYTLDWNMYCREPRKNALVTGGANI